MRGTAKELVASKKAGGMCKCGKPGEVAKTRDEQGIERIGVTSRR